MLSCALLFYSSHSSAGSDRFDFRFHCLRQMAGSGHSSRVDRSFAMNPSCKGSRLSQAVYRYPPVLSSGKTFISHIEGVDV